MPVIQTPEGEMHLPYDEQGMAMADALMGGGGQLPPEMMAGGPLPPEMMGGGGAPPPAGPEMSADDAVRQAIELIQFAVTTEPDDVDSHALSKILNLLYSLPAQRQKEHQQLMGGGNMRALSRAYGG